MAIAPIDLQTLYSQLENVSKTVAHQQQGVQLAQSIRQEVHARQEAEKNTAVQHLDSGQGVQSVKDNKNSKQNKDSGKEHSDENTEQESNETSQPVFFQDPNLGKYIDISG
ncbi:MAG: hypothetical protein J6B81_00060 [Spirochaetaceae bacterium]|nr:hypothetical protein [Spirochaetaceae bacterium]